MTVPREQLRLGATQLKLAVGGGVSSTTDPIDVTEFSLEEIKAAVGAADIANRLEAGEQLIHSSSKLVRVHLPVALPLRGGQRLVIPGSKPISQPDPTLIAALRKAHRMVRRERDGHPVVDAAPVSPYDRKILRLTFLAPDIQRDILSGRQPPTLNLQRLVKMDIPLAWSKQHEVLGWPSS